MKRICSILLGVILIFSFSGCKEDKYSGQYPELYTVAVNSLLWNKGISTETDKLCDPTITVMEKDDYGRILFEYTEKSFTQDIAFSSLLIMQAKNEQFVYYYEDYNAYCKEKAPSNSATVVFNRQEIEELKTLNDWDKDIDLDKCVKKQISNKKRDIPIQESVLDNIFSGIKGYRNNNAYYLTNDEYGRFICYCVVNTLEGNVSDDKYIVLLFDKELNYSIYEPSTYYGYQSEFKEFKKMNNWNMS